MLEPLQALVDVDAIALIVCNWSYLATAQESMKLFHMHEAPVAGIHDALS
jgi:hypothetical protein